MPGVGAVAARTLPLVEVPGGRVKRMLVVGAGRRAPLPWSQGPVLLL